MVDYVDSGAMPGDFLSAIFANDLFGALARGDTENLANLQAFASWIYMEAPANCHGSYKIVADWCQMGGMEGMDKNG